MNLNLKLFAIAVFFVLFSCTTYAADEFAVNTDIDKYIDDMAAKHGFSTDELKMLFSDARYIELSIKLMDRPAESLDWTIYMGRVITQARLKAGVRYYRKHKKELLAAQKKYNVQAYIIAGIIGLETNFGQIQMRYRAFDALSTLAFFYPRRAQFFTNELTELLLYARSANTDPRSYMSSYAGAVGIPQFMPSNIKKFAADGDNDDIVDIVDNHADAIFSVASYLAKHGWKSGEPVAVKVRVKGSEYANLLTKTPCSTKKISVRDMKKAGILFPGKISPKQMGNIIAVDDVNRVGYYAVFDNFCAIHKYNPSTRYVIAVNSIGRYIIKQEADVLRKATKPKKKVS